ncbi:MAG: NADAR family protein [Flammeovirgaceae bacterium]
MITEFQGEYRWLSNFAPVAVCMEGVVYPSVEHAYMSAKSDSIDWKMFCKRTKSPGAVKKASRDIQLIPN